MTDGRQQVTGDTYRDLEDYLDRYQETAKIDGDWPEVNMWNYDRGGSADTLAYRIRKGKIKTPGDHDWQIRVERVKRGTDGFNGPARVWVKYLGPIR